MSTITKLEYPKESGVTIRVVPNKTNGEAFGESYLVTLPGKVTGNGRERKQFRTLEAAKEHAAQAVAGVRAVGTRFVDLEHSDRDATLRLLDAIKERGGNPADVVDDAISALKAIGAAPLRLTECVVFALPRLAPAKGMVSVLEAVDSLKEAKAGDISKQYRRTLGVQLDRIVESMGTMPISHLDSTKINEFIAAMRLRSKKTRSGKVIPGRPASPKFRRHVLGAMRQLVRHAVSRGWLAKGIVDFEIVDAPRKSGASNIEFFNTEEMRALLKHAPPALVPFLAIGGFAALRPCEIERLDWKEVDLVRGHIEIKSRSNTKSENRRRLAHLPDNLKQWLSPIHRKSGRVFPISTSGGNLTERLQDLAKKAGLANWKKNGPRHSGISHRVALTGNVHQTSLECGNSPAVIHSSYLALVTREEAEKYFAIVPEVGATNITPMPVCAA